MTDLSDQIDLFGAPELQARLGEQVTYKFADDSPVTLTAVVGPIGTEAVEGYGGTVNRQSRTVSISTDSGCPNGYVADPKMRALVTIGSDDWSVESVEHVSSAWARLRCVFVGAASRSQDDMRRGE